MLIDTGKPRKTCVEMEKPVSRFIHSLYAVRKYRHIHTRIHIFHNVETEVGLKIQPGRQRTYNLTLRCVHAAIFATEKQ